MKTEITEEQWQIPILGVCVDDISTVFLLERIHSTVLEAQYTYQVVTSEEQLDSNQTRRIAKRDRQNR